MKCFVTGATGFIGSAVTEQLLEKNHDVTGLTHSPEKTQSLRKKGVQPAGVYGDGGIFAKYWTTPISRGKRAPYPGNGKQIKSFISVDDCARAYVKCIETPMPGEMFNVADDEPVAFGTLIRHLADKMEAPKPFGIPAPLFRLLGGKILGEMLLANMIMRVEDNGDGSSTLFHTTEYQLMPKFRPLGWLVETLFIKKLMDKNLYQSVKNCKQLIEKDI